MVLTQSLIRRLEKLEAVAKKEGSWESKSRTDYASVRTFFLLKSVILLLLLLVDIGFNSTVDHSDPHEGADPVSNQGLTRGMILFGCQIVAQVLAFVMFFLLLCGTYLFRVGLISVLSRYFKGVMGSTLVYLIATIVLGALRLAYISSKEPYYKIWDSSGFMFFSVLQKLCATAHYIINVQTTVQLGDPKFYSREPWVELYREMGK